MNNGSVFTNKLEFTTYIENLVKDNRDLTYMDAILSVCEERGIEIESIPRLIKGPLKKKIEIEAKKLNFIPHDDDVVSLPI